MAGWMSASVALTTLLNIHLQRNPMRYLNTLYK